MKKRALVMAGLVALTVMASTREAQAREVLAVTIPMGAYAANIVSPTHTLLLIRYIQCRSPNDSGFSNRNADRAKKSDRRSMPVFKGAVDRYFPAQVGTDGNHRGRQLLSTVHEEKMMQLANIEIDGQLPLVASLRPTRP